MNFQYKTSCIVPNEDNPYSKYHIFLFKYVMYEVNYYVLLNSCNQFIQIKFSIIVFILYNRC